MGYMRRIEMTDTFTAEVQHLFVLQRPRRPVGKIVDRDHAADFAV